MKAGLLFLTGMLLSANALFAQDPATELRFNRALLKYYNGNEINNFETVDPTNYENLENYFVRSFDVTLLNCSNCQIDYTEFFNQDLFNIVDHESKRLQNATFSFVYRDKYEITLHSITDVSSNLSGASIEEMTDLKVDRPFPSWIETGDFEADFEDYKTRVDDWANDFPEEFRTMTSSGDMMTIRKEDFRTLRPYRKDYLFNHPGGYLITD